MRNRGESQFEQLQLPGMPEPKTPASKPRHPGDLSEDKWLKKPDVYYHGTYRKNWVGPVVHMGGIESAHGRLSDIAVGSGIDARSGRVANPTVFARRIGGFDSESWEYAGENPASVIRNEAQRGRIYARRIPNVNLDPRYDEFVAFDDEEANAAHISYMGGRENVSSSIWGSVSYPEMEQVDVAADLLEQGKPIGYNNAGERDSESISVVAPDPEFTTRSYLQDVADSPNRPEHVRQYARQMHEQGYDPVRVAFPGYDKTVSSKQLSLPVKGDIKDENNIEDPEQVMGKAKTFYQTPRKPWTDL